ncbi:MAG: UDP-N-acetylmuramoyl-L-alanine--D-glutamate ligase [Clostridiales bacterium]|nr:UDP-N-acetylmuramoyl-L-alanine--D-glutamate ligase [Clostridiales bacterium]
MFPKQQKFLVLGLSRSGTAATEFLLEKGGKVYLYDDVTSAGLEKTIERLESLGGLRVKKEELSKMPEICDVLVLSPGIPIDHPIAISFRRAGKSIVGESELAVRYMRCLIVAVTGTNGKTTTVSMIEKIFTDNRQRAEACGNVGSPMIKRVDLGSEDIAVAEISSFQLETLNSLCPHVAVVLNITQDHLNRHYNMENYIFLKKKLLKNSTESEVVVLNYDDPIVKEFSENTRAKIVWFSLKGKVDGAYLNDGVLYYKEEKIMEVSDLPLAGEHNVQNALAAISVAKIMGVESEKIVNSLMTFKGVKHRIEKVAEIDGITYINDSKATNVDATLKAVACMKEETVLLLGGKDKGYDYTALFSALRNLKIAQAILYGENRLKLLDGAIKTGYRKVTLCDKFSIAVQLARLTAKSGQTVLLSPASASFDEFTGYEERGDKFVELVRSFEEKAKSGKENFELDDNAFIADEGEVE